MGENSLNTLFVLEDFVKLDSLTEGSSYLVLRKAFSINKLGICDLLLREKRNQEIVSPGLYEILFFNSIFKEEDLKKMTLEYFKNNKQGFLVRNSTQIPPTLYRVNLYDKSIDSSEYYTTKLNKLENELSKKEIEIIKENLRVLN